MASTIYLKAHSSNDTLIRVSSNPDLLMLIQRADVKPDPYTGGPTTLTIASSASQSVTFTIQSSGWAFQPIDSGSGPFTIEWSQNSRTVQESESGPTALQVNFSQGPQAVGEFTLNILKKNGTLYKWDPRMVVDSGP